MPHKREIKPKPWPQFPDPEQQPLITYHPRWCRICLRVVEDECFHCHVAAHKRQPS